MSPLGMGLLDEGCIECDEPAGGLTIGNGKCNLCHGTGIEGFSKCERCHNADGVCPRCNGWGYHFGSGHSPYPRERDDDEDTDEDSDEPYADYVSSGSPTYTPAASSWSPPETAPAKGRRSVFARIYFGASGALTLAYFVLVVLRVTGNMTPATEAAINRWFQSTVETPLGIALLLFFSVGLIVTGLALVALLLCIAIPLAIVLGLLSILLKAPQPWPIVGIGGALALLLVFFWLARPTRRA